MAVPNSTSSSIKSKNGGYMPLCTGCHKNSGLNVTTGLVKCTAVDNEVIPPARRKRKREDCPFLAPPLKVFKETPLGRQAFLKLLAGVSRSMREEKCSIPIHVVEAEMSKLFPSGHVDHDVSVDMVHSQILVALNAQLVDSA